MQEVDKYVQQLDIEEASLKAAIKYARWSAAAEYRLLASKGIKVGETSMADLEPYLGRGRLPVLERVSLALLNASTVDNVDKMAWSLGVDDAYGHDRFSMVAAVLKQIFLRASKGTTRTTLEEVQVVRNALIDADHDDQAGNLITRIALTVAPIEGDTPEAQVAAKLEFAAKHLSHLQGFLDRQLTARSSLKGLLSYRDLR